MDYNTHPVWGADYRRAVANGDTAYAQKLQRAMDASPQAADTAGQIMANTLAMGRGGNTWANGADGHQVNTQGQIRVAQAAASNLLPGTGGNLYRMNPAASGAPAPSQIIGQAAPTVTQNQFAATSGIPANYNPATGGPRSNSPTGEVAAPHGVTPIPKVSVETSGGAQPVVPVITNPLTPPGNSSIAHISPSRLNGVPQANPFTTQAARIAQAQANANAPRLYTGNFQRPTGLAAQPNLYSGLKFK